MYFSSFSFDSDSIEDTDDEVENTFVSLEMNPDGVHDLFFTFVGKDYDMISWRFIK